MDAMVSARVPVELRDQVNAGLRAIGSSPTELINHAYAFFLETKQLPACHPCVKSGRRALSDDQVSALAKSIAETSHAVPGSFFQDADYEQLLEDELRDAYEALA